MAVVAAQRHINPDLALDVTELVQKYHGNWAIRGLYTLDYLETAHAIEDILTSFTADPPILAVFDFEQQTPWTIFKPGTRVNWRQVKRTFNMFKKVTEKGQLRGALMLTACDVKGKVPIDRHVVFIGIADGGHYTTFNSMSGLKEEW